MNDRGTLTVRTRAADLAATQEQSPGVLCARVDIADTGCGIPEEHLQRMFQPFFTSKSGGSRSGSGLGLAIVQAIVNDHQGAVTVESRLGEGTRFTIVIPAASAEHSKVPTAGA